ncbi:MAG: sulfite exporter TauE/SafE family protein [Mycobacteriales bacterium]
MSGLTIAGAFAVAGAGLVAGAVNTIVGSGSLLTFPTLLALGYSPLAANVSNTAGLVLGSVSGAVGYRPELAGQGRRLAVLAVPCALGGLTGAVALLVLPAGVFGAVVPALILGACALVALQPWLTRRLAARRAREAPGAAPGDSRDRVGRGVLVGVFLASVYGGYFGAAIGVILIGLFGLLLDSDLQRSNAAKNVVAAIANAVATVLFAFLAPVSWPVVGLLAGSSVVGGQIGARLGRRLAPRALRAAVVVVGVGVAVRLLVG